MTAILINISFFLRSQKVVYVIKASGEQEPFSKQKILRTLKRAGATHKIAEKIVEKVANRVHDGMHTKRILKMVLRELHNEPTTCVKYNLKQSIMELGPTGFPFESYFAEILRNHGYTVQNSTVVQGKLIEHEIDICAQKDKRYMIECKFHNAPGIYTSAKVALYIYARYLDLKEKFDQPWIATNTKCSHTALRYANGVNMKITSWSHPKEESLQSLIESKKLYPITILQSMRGNTKERFARAHIMLAQDLLTTKQSELKKLTHLPESTLRKVLDEASRICEYT